METPDPNFMPEINLGIVDRVKAAGHWLADHLQFIPDLGITHGDHFKNTGAEAMLDEALDYEQIESD